MDAELKPCPFCGDKNPSLALCGFGTAKVTCMRDGCNDLFGLAPVRAKAAVPEGAEAVACWWVEEIGLGVREKPHPSRNPEPLYRHPPRESGDAERWMPIETAPRDGTQILLTNGDAVAQGWWEHQEPYIRERRDMEGRYIDQDESDGYDGWLDCQGGMLPEPTHWRPLPPAPDTARTAEEGSKV